MRPTARCGARGPGPLSIARLRPNIGPPRSRTLVNPRMSMSVAALPEAMCTKPISAVSTASCDTVANIRCVWASISPGISVRPRPSMTVAPGAAMAVAPMRVMTLPSTSTLVGPDSASDVPSNTRTFWNSTAGLAEGALASAVWAADVSLARATSTSAATATADWLRMRVPRRKQMVMVRGDSPRSGGACVLRFDAFE